MAAAPESLTQNVKLLAWISEIADLCKPDSVQMCEGTQAEYKELCDLLVEHGTFTKLNDDASARLLLGPVAPQRCGPGRRPHLHLHRRADRSRSDQQLGRPSPR